ncbi:BTB/POZ domain-containing protein kctd12 [Mayamaea pseudoterrestris]|nr:BTB/POZ domain-containing protein kctd12 [Mayamaea pseudoterrestris]
MSDRETLKRILDEVQGVKDDNESLKRDYKTLKLMENGGSAALQSPTTAGGRNQFEVPSPNDVISLNVGGRNLDVMRKTLTFVPGQLKIMFSGDRDKVLPRDSNGRFFLDESPILFTELVEHLRDVNRALPRDAEIRPSPPTFSDPEKQKRFFRMVDSMNMSGYLYPFHLHRYDPGDEKLHMVSESYSTMIDHAGEDYSYVLQRGLSNSRKVQSFEVQIFPNDCKSIEIGWQEYNLENSDNDNFQFRASFIVLNTETSEILASNNYREFDRRSVPLPSSVNPVIRCANRGAGWYMDGRLVAEAKAEVKELSSDIEPYISISGTAKFRITKLEYGY